MDISIEINKKFKNTNVLIQSPTKHEADLLADSLIILDSKQNKVAIETEDGFVFLKKDDIEYIEVLGTTITYYLNHKTVPSKGRLYQALENLDDNKFIQIHKSYVVNIEKIERLETYFSGNMLAYLSNGSKVNVSRRYLSELKSRLNIK